MEPPPPDPRVRPARPTDRDAIARCLGRAFHDDPVTRWLIGDRPDVVRRASILMGRYADVHRGHGSLFVASTDPGGDVAAVAIWADPGRWHVPLRRYLPHIGGFVVSLGARGLARTGSLRAIEQSHPREAHHYLAVLGTDPEAQGHGLGSALVRTVTDRADHEVMAAYLESSKPANVPFYARLGFVPGDDIAITSALAVTPMWRDPRP